MWVESGRKVVCISPGDKCTGEALEAARVLGTDFVLLSGGRRGSVIFQFNFQANCTPRYHVSWEEERLFAFPPETSVQMKLFEAERASAGNRFWITGGGGEKRGSVIFHFYFLPNYVWTSLKMLTYPANLAEFFQSEAFASSSLRMCGILFTLWSFESKKCRKDVFPPVRQTYC
jgi:hypothetical protein